MPPRTAQVRDVPGIAEALATGDPVACATRVAEVLRGGADRMAVVRTAALVAARQLAPAMPPPHALPVLGASLDLAAVSRPPELPILQACALAAAEWRGEPSPSPDRAVTGDELHLGRSFLVAVETQETLEADAIFSGLVREGRERRLPGDALFEASVRDLAGEGHKLTFAVGSWRLARALEWLHGPVLMRPAVHLVASPPADRGAYAAVLREAGRARLDVELAGRNVAPLDASAGNAYEVALRVGPERVLSEVINGLKRGRAAAAYGDLVAATAAERLVGSPAALEPSLFALATRFVLGFSRSSSRILALLQAARVVATLGTGAEPTPARIRDPTEALGDLERAIGADDPVGAAALASGLAETVDAAAIAPVLVRLAALEDAHADAGHRLVYAAWATEFADVAPGSAFAALAALLARTPKSRTVAER